MPGQSQTLTKAHDYLTEECPASCQTTFGTPLPSDRPRAVQALSHCRRQTYTYKHTHTQRRWCDVFMTHRAARQISCVIGDRKHRWQHIKCPEPYHTTGEILPLVSHGCHRTLAPSGGLMPFRGIIPSRRGVFQNATNSS